MHATLLRRDEELALLRPKAEYADRMPSPCCSVIIGRTCFCLMNQR